MKFSEHHTDLTLFTFGIVIVHDKSWHSLLTEAGYQLYNVFGYKIGFSYPCWFKKLFKIV